MFGRVHELKVQLFRQSTSLHSEEATKHQNQQNDAFGNEIEERVHLLVLLGCDLARLEALYFMGFSAKCPASSEVGSFRNLPSQHFSCVLGKSTVRVQVHSLVSGVVCTYLEHVQLGQKQKETRMLECINEPQDVAYSEPSDQHQ